MCRTLEGMMIVEDDMTDMDEDSDEDSEDESEDDEDGTVHTIVSR